ncbi:uncharacterized protein LOC105436403 [Strongylocentrotus purpuratus]|uniref:PH domain-containing protein n=1 Tax=Strongylocentrotus purpuratus TaxID=7668 RepID=A0A7M7NTF1_STRPU|nr:uncharacterized protein LOC105436403 [Strongylocentrotus purpuratus]
MEDDAQEKIHEGYLITGEQKNVDGGSTVDFKKRNKVYFVLWKRGKHLYNLEGFTNEAAFKGRRKSSVNVFGGRKKSLGSSRIPSHILTSRVNVHCMDMKIGRKTNHVIILIHSKIPYYFKTMKEQDIKPWYKAFSRVSKDMETRNEDRKPSEDVVLRVKNPNTNSTASRDSGRSSDASSARSSVDSSGSRNSDIISSCPPSPSFIPNNIVFEMDETEDHGEDDDEDHITPLSSGQKARRKLARSIIYKKVERSDSSGECKKKYDYTEASHMVYDSVIRTSIAGDDECDAPPNLPQKRRGRRGSEPNLQVPDVFRHRRDQSHSPKLDRQRIPEEGSPPPLPARPPSHYYENTRRMSVPTLPSSHKPDSQQEKGPKVVDISFLMWEQSKGADGIVVEFSKAELLDSVVLITINNEVWVAGWKKDLNSQLYGRLHVGDKLRQINTQVVTSAELAMEFIRTTAIDKIEITLYRLPNANILNLNRSDRSKQWGIHLKSNIEIKSLAEGPAVKEGLTPKAKAFFSGKPCDWVITEISHQRVPLVKSSKNQDLVKAELEEDHLVIPMVVQPHDFIKKLTEAIEKKRGSQFY